MPEPAAPPVLSQRRRAITILSVAGAITAGLSLPDAWFDYGASGFTRPDAWALGVLGLLALVVFLLAIGRARRSDAVPALSVAIADGVLAVFLLTVLVDAARESSRPSTGAWVAAAAIALSTLAATLHWTRSRRTAVLVVRGTLGATVLVVATL